MGFLKYATFIGLLISYNSFAIPNNFNVCVTNEDRFEGCYEIAYHSNGVVESLSYKKNNRQDGPSYIFNDNGQIFTKAWYVNNIATGAYQIYDTNSKIIKDTTRYKRECKVADDKAKGCVEKTFVNNILKYETMYKYGNQHGFQFEYYDGGGIKKMSYFKHGKMQALPFEFDDTSYLLHPKVCKTDDDKQQGCLSPIADGANNLLGQVFYKNGKKQDIVRINYKNGNPNKIYRYTDGLLDGVYTEFFESGKIKQQYVISAGKKTGVERLFREDGTVRQEMSYKDNLLNGSWIIYGDLGQISDISMYKDNKLNGSSKHFSDMGFLKDEQIYKDGVVIIDKQYNSNEDLVSISQIVDNRIHGYSVKFYDNNQGVQYIALYENDVMKEKTIFTRDHKIDCSYIYKDNEVVEVDKNSITSNNIDFFSEYLDTL